MSVQRGEAWLKTATAEQIVAATAAGELVSYLGGQTPDELAQAAHVAGAVDRVQAAAYGLTVGQLRGNGDRSSNWFEAKRRGMDATQLEKLNWVEQAAPAEVYAAEQAGELKHLTGQDITDEQARLADIQARVTAAVSAK